MNKLEIENPSYFLFGLVLIIILTAAFRTWYYRKKVIKKFDSPEILKNLIPDLSYGKLVMKTFIFCTAISLLCVSLVNPRFGIKNYKVTQKALEIIYLIDVSKSMDAEDVGESRLILSKKIIKNSLDIIEHHLVGGVAYANSADLLFPLTTDYDLIDIYTNNLDTNTIPSGGTNVKKALKIALNQFSKDSNADRLIVIFTDGEDHENSIKNLQEFFKKNNLKVLTLGIGSKKGAPIPIYDALHKLTDYKKDTNGDEVITRLNSNFISSIGETYETPKNSIDGVHAIESFLKNRTGLDKEIEISGYQYLFPYLTGIALLLLILNEFIFESKNKWIFN